MLYTALDGRQIFELAFPNRKRIPAYRTYFASMATIPKDCPTNLICPILAAIDGQRRSLTAMTVPKAAIDENHFAPARENYVGHSGQITAMQPESISHFMH
jgi:hypothetical protein